MTYELLKNKMTNGSPFTKADARKWIDALPLSVTPEQVRELEEIANTHGLDFLPEDGEGRLTNAENTIDELVVAVADIMGGAL